MQDDAHRRPRPADGAEHTHQTKQVIERLEAAINKMDTRGEATPLPTAEATMGLAWAAYRSACRDQGVSLADGRRGFAELAARAAKFEGENLVN